MSYSLGQAARATGKSKTTILRGIRSGKFSAEKDVHGQWIIDPSELHRVYPEVLQETVSPSENGAPRNQQLQQGLQHRIDLLEEQLTSSRKQVEYLEGQIEDLKGQREKLHAEAEAWRTMATQKRLTWRGLFGGGKAE